MRLLQQQKYAHRGKTFTWSGLFFPHIQTVVIEGGGGGVN